MMTCSTAQASANPVSYNDCVRYVRKEYGESPVISLNGGATADQVVACAYTDTTRLSWILTDTSGLSACDGGSRTCLCWQTTNNLDLGDSGVSYNPGAPHSDSRYYIERYVIGPSDVVVGGVTVTAVSDYTDCCAACSNAQPPPASPSGPSLPFNPPYSPQAPPPPPRPMIPPGSAVINPANAYIMNPFDTAGGCQGVVYWTDGTNNFCTLRSNSKVVTGTSQLNIGAYVGEYVFAKPLASPPPAPPQMEACIEFFPHVEHQIPQADSDGTSYLIPGAGGNDITTINYDCKCSCPL